MCLKNKKLIFNSDDFGHSHPFNMGVFKGIKAGVLSTSCILANLEGYNEAVALNSDLDDIDFGIHLNLIEGKSLTKSHLLTDSKCVFNNSYVDILRKSYDKNFLNQVEFEFRAQIERILNDFKISHINSHVHTHSIPNLFKLIVNLAEEYNIPYIRTQFEKPYYAKRIYPINLCKNFLLNYLTNKNKKYLKKGQMTNDFLVGVTYTGMMDKNTILKGLYGIKEGLVEVLIHPAYYEKEILKPNNYKEFLITQDATIIDEIENLGFEILSCSKVLSGAI